MPNQLRQHKSFLFATDMEPDDIVSLMMFLCQINELAKTSSTPLRVVFLVGEGNSAIKCARITKMLKAYTGLGLLKNVYESLIQGYSDFGGSQKNFAADGNDMLNEQEIAQAVVRRRDGSKPETQKSARDAIKKYLAANPATLVISLKPMRELLDIAREDSSVFKSHTLAATGSYNFRSSFWSQDKDAEKKRQDELVKLCNSFAQSYIYETHSTTETNTLSSVTGETFFKLLKQSPEGALLDSLRIQINDWKIHLLAEDRRRLPELLARLKGILSEAQQASFTTALMKDYAEADWKQLRQVVDDGQQKHAGNKDALDAFQSLGRLLGKWKNLTQAELQIVNADPGLLAVLSGACDNHLGIQPAAIRFQGSYTVLSAPDENTKTRVYLPGKNTTLAQYLEWRKQETTARAKPAELKSAQDALLVDINNAITQAGVQIYDVTARWVAKMERLGLLMIKSQTGSLYQAPKQDKEEDNEVILSPFGYDEDVSLTPVYK